MAAKRPFKAMDNRYLACRTLKHAWDETPVSIEVVRGKTWNGNGHRITIRCLRCPMLRKEVLSKSTGMRLTSVRYVRPRDYRIPRDEMQMATGGERSIFEVFRQEYLARVEA